MDNLSVSERDIDFSDWENQKYRVILFPQIYYYDYFNIRRVHPLKQEAVIKISKYLRMDDRVQTAVLFGSSINLRCNYSSDIDLVIRLKNAYISIDNKNDISENVQELCDWDADILWYDAINHNENIYFEVLRGIQIV